MRLVLISDTHGLHSKLDLPEGDVLVHAGDLTARGKLSELAQASSWLNAQIGKFHHVVAIGGNHDFCLEHFMTEKREDLLGNIFGDVIYSRDRSVMIDGVKFYGTPWCPQFNDWAFNLARGPEIKAKWDMIPADTDVLVTHTPPFGVLDHYWQYRLGDEDLMERVKFIKPDVHVFGHVHNAYGSCDRDGTQFVNACSTAIEKDSQDQDCYVMRNAPMMVDI